MDTVQEIHRQLEDLEKVVRELRRTEVAAKAYIDAYLNGSDEDRLAELRRELAKSLRG